MLGAGEVDALSLSGRNKVANEDGGCAKPRCVMNTGRSGGRLTLEESRSAVGNKGDQDSDLNAAFVNVGSDTPLARLDCCGETAGGTVTTNELSMGPDEKAASCLVDDEPVA